MCSGDYVWEGWVNGSVECSWCCRESPVAPFPSLDSGCQTLTYREVSLFLHKTGVFEARWLADPIHDQTKRNTYLEVAVSDCFMRGVVTPFGGRVDVDTLCRVRAFVCARVCVTVGVCVCVCVRAHARKHVCIRAVCVRAQEVVRRACVRSSMRAPACICV